VCVLIHQCVQGSGFEFDFLILIFVCLFCSCSLVMIFIYWDYFSLWMVIKLIIMGFWFLFRAVLIMGLWFLDCFDFHFMGCSYFGTISYYVSKLHSYLTIATIEETRTKDASTINEHTSCLKNILTVHSRWSLFFYFMCLIDLCHLMHMIFNPILFPFFSRINNRKKN
jgi:hypothetical protein